MLCNPDHLIFFQDEQIPEDIRCLLMEVFWQKKNMLIEDPYFDPRDSDQNGIMQGYSLDSRVRYFRKISCVFQGGS